MNKSLELANCLIEMGQYVPFSKFPPEMKREIKNVIRLSAYACREAVVSDLLKESVSATIAGVLLDELEISNREGALPILMKWGTLFSLAFEGRVDLYAPHSAELDRLQNTIIFYVNDATNGRTPYSR